MKTKILLLLFIVITGLTLTIAKANAMSAAKENSLGNDYYLGLRGIKQSYSKANFWYRKAAAQGNANAEYNLGLFYAYGWPGVKNPNKFKAIYWYKKAAAQGIPPAAYILMTDYSMTGRGSEPDYESKNISWVLPTGKRYEVTGYYSLKEAEWFANETLQEKAVNILVKYEKEKGVGNSHYVSWLSEHNRMSGQYKYTVGTVTIITNSRDSVSNGATISGINFGSQLQSSLLSLLNGTGYKNDITANTSMAFLIFASDTKNIANIFNAAVAINNMINNSDFKVFNELTTLYAKYIIKKNS